MFLHFPNANSWSVRLESLSLRLFFRQIICFRNRDWKTLLISSTCINAIFIWNVCWSATWLIRWTAKMWNKLVLTIFSSLFASIVAGSNGLWDRYRDSWKTKFAYLYGQFHSLKHRHKNAIEIFQIIKSSVDWEEFDRYQLSSTKSNSSTL